MFTRERAIENYGLALESYGQARLSLVAAAAVVFISGAIAAEADQVSYADATKELRAIVKERGYEKSQAYKYLGLARQFVAHLEVKFPDKGGIIASVAAERSPAKAADVLLAYLEENEVTSLDALGAFIGGRYQRSPRVPTGEGAGEGTGGAITMTPEERKAAHAVNVTKEVVAKPLDYFEKILTGITDISVLVEMKVLIDDRLTALREAQGIHDGRVKGKGTRAPARERAQAGVHG